MNMKCFNCQFSPICPPPSTLNRKRAVTYLTLPEQSSILDYSCFRCCCGVLHVSNHMALVTSTSWWLSVYQIIYVPALSLASGYDGLDKWSYFQTNSWCRQLVQCAAEVLTIVQVQDESPWCIDQWHHLQFLYSLQAVHIQHGVSGTFWICRW